MLDSRKKVVMPWSRRGIPVLTTPPRFMGDWLVQAWLRIAQERCDFVLHLNLSPSLMRFKIKKNESINVFVACFVATFAPNAKSSHNRIVRAKEWSLDHQEMAASQASTESFVVVLGRLHQLEHAVASSRSDVDT